MIVLYLLSLASFFILFYLLISLTWFSALILSLLLSLALILILYPGVNNSYMGEILIFSTGLLAVVYIAAQALKDYRVSPP